MGAGGQRHTVQLSSCSCSTRAVEMKSVNEHSVQSTACELVAPMFARHHGGPSRIKGSGAQSSDRDKVEKARKAA